MTDILCVQHIKTTNDINGNPRRLYVAYDAKGDIAHVYEEGYLGRKAKPIAVEIMSVKVSVSEYNSIKKFAREHERYTPA